MGTCLTDFTFENTASKLEAKGAVRERPGFETKYWSFPLLEKSKWKSNTPTILKLTSAVLRGEFEETITCK